MGENETGDGWLSWRSIPRLAASLASWPVVIGYASMDAALGLGRSLGEVIWAASGALERVTENATRTEAIATGLRRARNPTKRRSPPETAGRPTLDKAQEATVAEQPAAAGPHASHDSGAPTAPAGARRPGDAGDDAGPLAGLTTEFQWIVWSDAACVAEWTGVTLRFDWSGIRAGG